MIEPDPASPVAMAPIADPHAEASPALDCDVLVVGGGPVGAAAALALRDAGYRTLLLERSRPAPFDPARWDGRVYAVSPASEQLLRALGAWEAMLAVRAAPYTRMHVWWREPAQALQFEAADVDLPELGWIIEHNLIVEALWQQFDERLTVITGTTVAEAQFASGDCRLKLTDGRRIRAGLVIGADGAESQLRLMAGIEPHGWHYGQRGIIAHVQTARPIGTTCWQRFLPSGPLAFLPLPDGRASIVWSALDARAEELMALDDTAFCAALTEASQGVLGEVLAITPRVAIPLRLRNAETYAVPGLVLVGDAAHVVHPLAGQGVNLGFGDLGLLLEHLQQARARGAAPLGERVLRHYARARRAQAAEMLGVTDLLARGFTSPLHGLMGRGMVAVNRIAPLRSLLTHKAVGQ